MDSPNCDGVYVYNWDIPGLKAAPELVGMSGVFCFGDDEVHRPGWEDVAASEIAPAFGVPSPDDIVHLP